jgi:hypothetical protein
MLHSYPTSRCIRISPEAAISAASALALVSFAAGLDAQPVPPAFEIVSYDHKSGCG